MSTADLRPRRFSLRGTRLIAVAASLGLLAGALVRNFSYYPLRVASSSMSPSVAKGDWVVVSPLRVTDDAADNTVVHRGDIVLFRFPFGGSGRAIKRVVAVAGDRVEVEGDKVRVNPDQTATHSAGGTLVIPEGYFYILGDNLASSLDSRTLGLLHQTEVLGKVAAVIEKPW